MEKKYREYKQLNLTDTANVIGKYWEDHKVFSKSLDLRKGHKPFIFYEGPPSANGKPGIHHVMARAIKDIFCRYKTQKGFLVDRKAGWDTHGLPVEISVEKTLGITKEDIGNKISVEEYNQACRTEVMKYKDLWDELTVKMGYWVDLDNPYITFDNKYIETVWWLLKKLHDKKLLYKGYTIQPYSPAAGTGLSSHELNLPGCYRDVKDLTVVAQFKAVKNEKSEFLFKEDHGDVYFLAWTTTAWTLPSNTALAVGKKIMYNLVQTYNPYTALPVSVVVAKDLLNNFFPEKNAALAMDEYEPGQKAIPFSVIGEFSGADLEGIRYEQLLPYAQPENGDAFRIVSGDFVTTEDGTGIVHIAPSFGADDFKVGRENGIGSLTMVDKQGKFIDAMGEFAGRYVKNEYAADYDPETAADPVDIDIIVKLKKENKAFKTEKYEHSYPHCWRTDKPILYYPLDSWFVKTTAYKERMMELNKIINWKPAATGTGRFGNWLENLVDWNLSRSRFWGTPLPIWVTDDREEEICIGSADQLYDEIEKSVKVGFMDKNPMEGYNKGDMSEENYNTFDLHRPFVDDIFLVSPSGKKMYREPDLIDVWFDSGSMPYAQFHYPFENSDLQKYFPSHFIAEGVDQTRGWFFTLHAIAVMLFDNVSFKTCVSNGLVLDKDGNKMSKRLGNAVDPFETIQQYGPDATRWYMMTNSQPWDNLKFDSENIKEVQRKFFGTLYNTYAFFALYANIDAFTYAEDDIPAEKRPEIDRWILSELNTLIGIVDDAYGAYEPTRAGRAIVEFVNDHLSNWYVRLSRRRFWKGEYSSDKISAYQTLYTCLDVVAKLSAPIAPFYMERLFIDLNEVSGKEKVDSIHLTDFPAMDNNMLDKDLEERMQLAQKFSSMVLSLRKKSNIRVRQPLNKLMIPVLNAKFERQLKKVEDLILSEVNVKEIEYLQETAGILVKSIKPNFKTLGPKYGKMMKQIAAAVNAFTQDDIAKIEQDGKFIIHLDDKEVDILLDDVEIVTEDIPGWLIAGMGPLTVALDISLTPELIEEGISRDLVNRIQNLRKDRGFEVTDKINLKIEKNSKISNAIQNNYNYICSETLAESLDMIEKLPEHELIRVELADKLEAKIILEKV
ncbi:MAG: isoleucine--tRNA ligase [Bacteroidales bacterium]|nr:isoleucine--tRNA ligase [Bacteroidales bacterium]